MHTPHHSSGRCTHTPHHSTHTSDRILQEHSPLLRCLPGTGANQREWTNQTITSCTTHTTHTTFCRPTVVASLLDANPSVEFFSNRLRSLVYTSVRAGGFRSDGWVESSFCRENESKSVRCMSIGVDPPTATSPTFFPLITVLPFPSFR